MVQGAHPSTKNLHPRNRNPLNTTYCQDHSSLQRPMLCFILHSVHEFDNLTKICLFFILRSHIYNESIDQMQYVFPQGRPGIRCKGFCRLHVAFNVLYHYLKPCWNVRPAAVQLGQGMRNDTTAPNMPFAHSVAVIRHGMQKPCFFHSICPVQFGLITLDFHPRPS